MSQMLLIVFFIAAHLVPVNVSEFTVSFEDDENITFTRQSADSWKIKEDSKNQLGVISIKGTSITVGPKDQQSTIDISQILSVSTNTNWKTVSEVKMGEQSLHVQRNKAGAVISTPSGKETTQSFKVKWEKKK